MADVITELRRPSTLGAVIFAVIGWLLLIWSFAESTSDQDALRLQLGAAQTRSGQLADELKRERDAAGQVAELEKKRAAAEADLRRLQGEVQDATRTRTEAQGQIESLRSQLAGAQRDTKEAGSQRDKLLLDLDAVRQQSETLKQAFARASEQLAQKNSELAALNGKVQEQQAKVAQLADQQTKLGTSAAQAQEAAKVAVADRDRVVEATAKANSELESLQQQLSALNQQISDRQKALAEPSEKPQP